ncbi:MAG: hypothetical protein AAF360_02200, partial [Pseudomonadota bacterium]
FAGVIASTAGEKAIVKRSSEEREAIERVIALAKEELRATVVPAQAAVIAQTSQQDMEDAVSRARDILIAYDEALTPAALATTAAAILRTRFLSRAEVVAQTETQAAAESARQIEAEAIAGIVPFALAFAPVVLPARAERATKTWVTLGDDRVRPGHQMANRQSVDVDGRFSVGGESLRYPGDVLNGSIGNVINCRCSAEYRIS